MTKGWGFPVNSRKAHYFVFRGTSICGKWMYGGSLEDNNHHSSDNCKECYKRAVKAGHIKEVSNDS